MRFGTTLGVIFTILLTIKTKGKILMNKNDKNNRLAICMMLGVCLGAGVGIIIGVICGNIPIGLCGGIPVGSGLGIMFDSIIKKK